MFLDANIFIHAYDSKDGQKHEQCKQQLKRVISGEMKAHTSPLVLNEVAYFFSQNYGLAHAEKVFNQIRKTPNLIMLGIDEGVLDHVFRFAGPELGITDAYHAAVMYQNGIGTICTYDRAFDKAKGLKRQEPK